MRSPKYQTVCPKQLNLVPWINVAVLRSYYYSETLYASLLSLPSTVKHEPALRNYLTSEHKWLPSMQTFFMDTISHIAYRYFICDNSYDMTAGDGHIYTEGGTK